MILMPLTAVARAMQQQLWLPKKLWYVFIKVDHCLRYSSKIFNFKFH
jgi:hypothetical protein